MQKTLIDRRTFIDTLPLAKAALAVGFFANSFATTVVVIKQAYHFTVSTPSNTTPAFVYGLASAVAIALTLGQVYSRASVLASNGQSRASKLAYITFVVPDAFMTALVWASAVFVPFCRNVAVATHSNPTLALWLGVLVATVLGIASAVLPEKLTITNKGN